MKTKTLEAFYELGFTLSPIEDMGFEFEYDGIQYLYLPNEKDDEFLNIAIPGFYKHDESNPIVSYGLMNQINSTIKYVKAYQLEDRLWLFYEREMIDEPDLKKTISQMILHLEAALAFARNLITEKSSIENNDSTDF